MQQGLHMTRMHNHGAVAALPAAYGAMLGAPRAAYGAMLGAPPAGYAAYGEVGAAMAPGQVVLTVRGSGGHNITT
jgi:hypothetical protein